MFYLPKQRISPLPPEGVIAFVVIKALQAVQPVADSDESQIKSNLCAEALHLKYSDRLSHASAFLLARSAHQVIYRKTSCPCGEFQLVTSNRTMRTPSFRVEHREDASA